MKNNDVLFIFVLCLMFVTTGYFLSRLVWRDLVYPDHKVIVRMSYDIPLGNIPQDVDTYSIIIRLENLPSWDGSNWDARWIDYGWGDAIIDYGWKNGIPLRHGIIDKSNPNPVYCVKFILLAKRTLTAEITYYKLISKTMNGITSNTEIQVGSFYFTKQLDPYDYL